MTTCHTQDVAQYAILRAASPGEPEAPVDLPDVLTYRAFCGWWMRGAEQRVELRRFGDARFLCQSCAAPTLVGIALGVCCFVAWATA